MRSLYLIRYTMQNGSLSVVPSYSHNLAEALRKFHAFMAGLGCEKNTYRVTSTREIAEPAIRLSAHVTFIERLSDNEQLQFFQDRHDRQGVLAHEKTIQNLTRLRQREFV